MNFLILFVNLITYSLAYPGKNMDVAIHHWEKGSDNFVKGGYSLLDSDGRVRVVEYEVEGDRGFHAVVSYRPPGGYHRHLVNANYAFRRHNPVQLQQPVGLITRDLLY